MNREQIQETFVSAVIESTRFSGGAQLAFAAQKTCRDLGIDSLHAKEAKAGIMRVLRVFEAAGIANQDMVSGAVADWLLERGYGE